MEDTLPVTLRTNGSQARSYQLINGVEALSSTELNVSWSQPDEELVNGKLYAYKIVYFAEGEDKIAGVSRRRRYSAEGEGKMAKLKVE